MSVRRFTPLVRVARCRRTICLLMGRPLPGIEFGDGGVADGSIGALYERRLAGSTIHETGLPESGCSPPAPYAADPTETSPPTMPAMRLRHSQMNDSFMTPHINFFQLLESCHPWGRKTVVMPTWDAGRSLLAWLLRLTLEEGPDHGRPIRRHR